jgi:hypothetical protein
VGWGGVGVAVASCGGGGGVVTALVKFEFGRKLLNSFCFPPAPFCYLLPPLPPFQFLCDNLIFPQFLLEPAVRGGGGYKKCDEKTMQQGATAGNV